MKRIFPVIIISFILMFTAACAIRKAAETKLFSWDDITEAIRSATQNDTVQETPSQAEPEGCSVIDKC